jgi:uncharacterized RDD family membrane protein YckC
MGANEPTFSWGSDALSRSGARTTRVRSERRTSLIGARACAVLIDGLVLLVPVFAVDYAMSLLFPHRGFALFSSASGSSFDGELGLSGLLLTTALCFSYFFLCEATTGTTVGKRVMGLRVRSASGEPAGLNAISARTVLRLLDAQLLYLLGAFVAIVTGRRRRRVGDWLGGTVVVRDSGGLSRPLAREPWRLAIFPVCWITGALVLIFALGVGTAIGRGEEALTLVRSYVQARERGDATLACSMLTIPQQREVVAIEGGSYATASPQRCPAYILRAQPNSTLLNPGLAQLLEQRLVALDVAGAEVVRTSAQPGLELVAVREGGTLRLDVRGLQQIEFVRSCAGTGRATAAVCSCTWEHARVSGLLNYRLEARTLAKLRGDEQLCVGRPGGPAA